MKIERPTCALAALALSCLLPLSSMAQEGTNDPFLDAMLGDMKKEPAPAQPETPAPAPAKNDAAPAPAIQPHDSVLQFNRELVGDSALLVDERSYDGQRVAQVLVRTLDKRNTVPTKRMLDVISTSAGSKYSATRVNADLERLIKRGLVDGDSRVAVEPGSGGLNVVFEVKSANILGGVGFTGANFFTPRSLREKTKLSTGRGINDRDLAAARAAIIKEYQEARFPDVKVSWRQVSTQRSAYRDIIFDIQEGPRVQMNQISFVGNRQFDSEQLRQVMETKEKSIFYWFNKHGRIDREKLEDDMDALVRHYRNFGYLRARVSKVEYKNYGQAGNQKLGMVVTIEEGPRYRVRKVSFDGVKAYTPAQLRPGLSMLDGDIYSLKKVSDDIDMIRDYYGVKGYADADIRPDVDEVGTDSKGVRLIDIKYKVNEGGRFAVGRINMRGNVRTKRHVILRELPLKPGSYMNSIELETARKRLMNLNYFDAVEVSQSASATPGYRDINVNVREKLTGSLNFGLAFSSVENVYLYATVTQSNFDIRGLFNGGTFVGGGQRMTVTGKLGTEQQAVSIYLLEPWFFDRKLAFGNELFYSNSSYMSDYYDQANYGFATSLSRSISEYASVRLSYRLEQYNLDQKSDAPPFFRANCGDFTRSHFELSYNYDTRDAIINPRSGGHFEARIGYSGPGSTVETYNAGIAASYYHNSIWDSIWSINFGAETVDAANSDEVVPLFERCYLGGPNNLRGFRYRDVGMVNEALAGDETMGGQSSAFVQLEVTVPLMDTLRLAAFIDAGFVHADSCDFKLTEFAANYGIGLRLNLPMGPLAVDYAIPFKSENAIDRNGQFQFYVNYKY